MGNVYYPRAKVVLDFVLDPFSSGGDPLSRTVEATPRMVEVERNSIREADVARVELDYRQFPFDPRTIQSVTVGVSMGDVLDPEGKLSKRRRAFLGTVDNPKTSLSASGETVNFTCRDYTAIFLDAPWDTTIPIRVDRSLFLIVQDFLTTVPGAAGLRVVFSEGLNQIVLAHRLGVDKWVSKQRKKADAWSVLSELLGKVALLPVIVQDELRILEAGDFGNPTPTRFVYGQNLSSLNFERKTRETRTKQILVRQWNPRKREATEALFPKAPIVTRSVRNANGKLSQDFANVLPFDVTGTNSVAELTEIAERIYNDNARNQIEGSFETNELRDLDSQALPTMSNGDSVSLLLGKDERASISGLGLSEAVALLTTGPDRFDREVARALVLAYRRADTLATKFYVTTAVHRWTRDEGYKLRATFQNFAGAGR